MSIQKTIQAGLLLAVALYLTSSNQALALGGKLLDQTGCSCCPVCDHVCKLDAEVVDEEKTCFHVESKVICIPRVVFPWQKAKKAACASCNACDGLGCTNCVHNGARVRRICVLKPEKYTCPACKYTWTAEKKPCGGCGTAGCGTGACCGGHGCDSGCAAAPAAPMPTPTPATPSPAIPAPVAAPQAEPTVDASDYYRQFGSGISAIPAPVAF
ncbi:hypothetical protein [Stieleria mannarensis]|uniref:hypothetical protein n=1 Tax=Stieleria mannarensis TaxID=2755585 RepID=UPI00160136B4|nr:hypothetical protein [Rhodopirellula sp. JC639]